MTTTGHPVLDLLRARRAAGSRPGRRDDGATVALAVEGGGMRGVVAGGMVTALDRLGYRDAFDLLYGSSAGACASAYFLAGQAALGTSIFYEDINNRRFIDPRRALTGRPVMDIDFLIDEVMRHRKPLAVERIAVSEARLSLIATDVDTVASRELDAFATGDAILEAMRASARLPLLGGDPVHIGGRRYLDGGILQPVPFDAALASAATHVLLLLTWPADLARGRPSRVDRHVIAPLLRRRYSPLLADAYLARPLRYMATRKRIDAMQADAGAEPQVFAITLPAGARPVGRMETGRELLVAGATTGGEAVSRLLA
jgi:predicted patatin/cPLA2 family phospholipase